MTFYNLIEEINYNEKFYLEHDRVIGDYLELGISLECMKNYPDLTLTQYAVLAHKQVALEFLLETVSARGVPLQDIIYPKTANEKRGLFELAIKSKDEGDQKAYNRGETYLAVVEVLLKFAVNKSNSVPVKWLAEVIKIDDDGLFTILQEQNIELFPFEADLETIITFFKEFSQEGKDDYAQKYKDRIQKYYPGEDKHSGFQEKVQTKLNDLGAKSPISLGFPSLQFLVPTETRRVEPKPRGDTEPESPSDNASQNDKPQKDKCPGGKEPCVGPANCICKQCHGQHYCEYHLAVHSHLQ